MSNPDDRASVLRMIVQPQPWLPQAADVVSKLDARNPATLTAVVQQFEVETSPRYHAKPPDTFCNIFVWDVTSAMGAEVPHWVDLAGAKTHPGGGAELTANSIVSWLEVHGAQQGWTEVTPRGAQDMANCGRPVVAVARNAMGKGHIAVVVPAPSGGPWIAQAGIVNFSFGTVGRGFGAHTPRYWAHQ